MIDCTLCVRNSTGDFILLTRETRLQCVPHIGHVIQLDDVDSVMDGGAVVCGVHHRADSGEITIFLEPARRDVLASEWPGFVEEPLPKYGKVHPK